MNIKEYKLNSMQFIETKNDNGFRIVFCSLGASIFQIYDGDICLTRNVKDIEDFKKPDCYYGKTIGRTANRIRGHKIIIDGKGYTLENNEKENVLHGGLNGLSTREFNYEIIDEEEYTKVVFRHLSKHLESGYPGNLNVEVGYKVYHNENKIGVDYLAYSDEDTLCSLTNHSYFTLGSKDISELSLQIDSDFYLNVDDELLALGKEKVEGKFDYKNAKILAKTSVIDHFFYFNHQNCNVVTLKNDKYELNVSTDFEGVQIYTSNGRSPYELFPGCENQFDSVAIEPSDSHLDLHFLKKNERYERHIVYNMRRL